MGGSVGPGWAVVIGVGDYEHPGVARLNYTVPDAQGVYDVLTTVAGFKPDHDEYLEQQVTQKSRAVGGNQHPGMTGELEGVLPLVGVRAR